MAPTVTFYDTIWKDLPYYTVDEPMPPVDAIPIDSDEDIAGGSP